MKNLYLIGLLVLSMILTSCGPPPIPQDDGDRDRRDRREDRDRTVNRGGDDYDRLAREDKDRERVIDRSRDRRPGRACEAEDRDHDCHEQCRDIYGRRKFRDKCEELSVSQIDSLNILHELLEDPNEDELADINFEDFDVYLNISIEPLDKLIGKYSKSEAKEFIFWLIGDEDASKVFEKEDEDYDAFTALLKSLSGTSFTGNNLKSGKEHEPFTAKIDGSDRLMEVAVENGNDETINWFMDYINEKVSACESEETSTNCFKVYCKIGDGIDKDYQDDWLDYEDFRDYIDDIIEEGTNKKSTSANSPYYWGSNTNNTFEDAGDVDNWVRDLCKPTGGTNLTT